MSISNRTDKQKRPFLPWSTVWSAATIVFAVLVYFCFGSYVTVMTNAEVFSRGTRSYDFAHEGSFGEKYSDLGHGTLLRCSASDLESLEYHTTEAYENKRSHRGYRVARRKGSLIAVSSPWFGYEIGLVRSTEVQAAPWNVALNRLAWILMVITMYCGFKAFTVQGERGSKEKPLQGQLF